MSNVVHLDTEMTLSIPGKMVVPLGSEISEWRIEQGYVVFKIVGDYDYEPFADPEKPTFDFQADVIRCGSNGERRIDRNVTCQSLPGRNSVVKGE